MQKLVQLLIGLAVLAFIMATVQVLLPVSILGIFPESFSRACDNLALIAIALTLCCKKCQKES